MGSAVSTSVLAGAHLNDGNLVLGAQAQQRLRHTYVVVEISLGGQHIVLLAKHGLHQFLCSGLSVGPGNGNDGNVELAAMLAGQVLVGLQAVFHKYEALVGGVFLFVYDGQCTSFLQGLCGELVSIEGVALQGQEDTADGAVAAIRRNARMLLVQSI